MTDKTTPDSSEPPRFTTSVRPLFRERDRDAMRFAFDLWSYQDVKQHAPEILQRLDKGTMPCDGAWPAERLATFRSWIETGMPE